MEAGASVGAGVAGGPPAAGGCWAHREKSDPIVKRNMRLIGFSIPVVVGRSGIIRHLHPKLNEGEQQVLRTAAVAIKSAIVALIPDLVDDSRIDT